MKAGIGLGSNLGDRLAHLSAARQFLAPSLASPAYETEPVGCAAGSPAFLNAVVEIEFAGTARELLRQLLAYELAHGRDRSVGGNAARTIDLDLLYFGDAQIAEPDLVVPHPRIASRRFVLEPLAAIRSALVLPGQTRSVRKLLAGLPASGGAVRLFATEW
jgi:2-amino-4-hydroxy-6-hydroxymethyldihydropteridine diphosphokinase